MKSIWRTIGKILFRTFLILFTTVLLLLGGVAGLVYTFNHGPSPAARKLLVSSMLETSAIGFLSVWFLPTEEIPTIQAADKVADFDVITNPDLIIIPERNSENEDTEKAEKDIEIIKVSGLTYSGTMMIVKDPSRVSVATCKHFGDPNQRGDKILTLLERHNALAGINGGGFYDPNGHGTGSIPLGFVFSQGEFLYDSEKGEDLIIGFDKNDKLIVGNMTGKEAQALGIRDALTYGPALIINGEKQDVSSGLNPRTAIGQRSDGAVLLLVVDGRQANSLGASYADLIDIMDQHGAINAANLDGGSSSIMIYEGETISHPSALLGDRYMPACFMVERRESDEE